MSKKEFLQTYLQNFRKVISFYWVRNMIVREKYLNKMIIAKDTEFIKVITGVRRSGKSTLMLMFKEYLTNNGISEEN